MRQRYYHLRCTFPCTTKSSEKSRESVKDQETYLDSERLNTIPGLCTRYVNVFLGHPKHLGVSRLCAKFDDDVERFALFGRDCLTRWMNHGSTCNKNSQTIPLSARSWQRIRVSFVGRKSTLRFRQRNLTPLIFSLFLAFIPYGACTELYVLLTAKISQHVAKRRNLP